jgi:SAM-dependent MidA family methyltransferase
MTVERFDEYVERCLYGPDGFYATEGSAGRRSGDFLTSPEVGPLFGAVLTRFLDAVWKAEGEPEPFSIHDVGCGPGTLLRTVAVAAGDLGGRPWDLVGVDRVESPAATAQRLPDDLAGAVVVANELLDNLPFRVIERGEGGFREVFVRDPGQGGVPVEELAATDVELDIPVGTRAPLLERARSWMDSVLARGPVAVAVFDYGAPTTAELAGRGGWLRTYREHRRGEDPLRDPGRWDITTDVAWDQLPTPDRLETQVDFLGRWGIDELVEEGRTHWRQHAAAPDLTALRMRSRISEVEALVDPGGLGGWWAASWSNLGD